MLVRPDTDWRDLFEINLPYGDLLRRISLVMQVLEKMKSLEGVLLSHQMKVSLLPLTAITHMENQEQVHINDTSFKDSVERIAGAFSSLIGGKVQQNDY